MLQGKVCSRCYHVNSVCLIVFVTHLEGLYFIINQSVYLVLVAQQAEHRHSTPLRCNSVFKSTSYCVLTSAEEGIVYLFLPLSLQLTDSLISQLSPSLSKVETLDLRGCKQVGNYMVVEIIMLSVVYVYPIHQ